MPIIASSGSTHRTRGNFSFHPATDWRGVIFSRQRAARGCTILTYWVSNGVRLNEAFYTCKNPISGGYDLRFLQRTRSSPIDLARKRFPRPSTAELNDYLSNTISFLIVREPFERLVSAYRNKLEGCRNKYYKLLGEQIVKRFRKKLKEGSKSVSVRCSGLLENCEITYFMFFSVNIPRGQRFGSFWSS